MFSGLGRLNSLKFTSSRCVEPGGGLSGWRSQCRALVRGVGRRDSLGSVPQETAPEDGGCVTAWLVWFCVVCTKSHLPVP